MKKIISAILLLTLCLSLCACSFVVIPDRQNEQTSAPEVTIDPNAEPEIVTDAASVKLKPLDTGSARPVCYFRSTEGTNCSIAGIVAVEYLDASEKVLYTFSPQLPGGTFSAGGYAGGKTSVTERAGNRGISYTIDTETDKLLSCEYFEVNLPFSTCSRLDLYDDDGQVATSIEVSKEGNDLSVDHTVDRQGNSCSYVYESVHTIDYIEKNGTRYEVSGFPYNVRTLFFDQHEKLVVEIIHDPIIGMDTDGSIYEHARNAEIKNAAGEVIAVYTPSAPDSAVGAHFNCNSGLVDIIERRSDHKKVLLEQLDPTTGAKVSRETFDYSEGGTLIQEETTRWDKDGIVFFHWLITYDASGEVNSNEIEFWGGKVVTTFDTTYNGIYSKAEFYNAEGVLQKTVEPVDGSVGFLLDFSKEDHCVVEFYDKDGGTVSYDFYWPES